MQLKLNDFIELLNVEDYNFFDYNKHSLYIIRGGNYLDIKNIFTAINNQQFNLGRGGGQKAHMLSPLDFRLSSYMLAMSNFNYQLVSSLNTFNYISKDRYLSWSDKSSLFSNLKKAKCLKRIVEFKPIYVNKMPCSNNEYSDEYSLCSCINK